MRKSVIILIILLVSLTTSAGSRQWGIPYFQNYTAREYGGHNRNFDVECDGEGHVFIANFEGLLIYDYHEWKMIHTPGISRVTCLYKEMDDHDQHVRRIWFGGYNVLGYAETGQDSIAVTYVHSDRQKDFSFGEVRVIYKVGKELRFLTNEMGNDHAYSIKNGKVRNDGNVRSISALRRLVRLQNHLPEADARSMGRSIAAQENGGVCVISQDGEILSSLSTRNGLCSDNITDLAYDDHGMVWGTTDNGIFRVATTGIYTHFGEQEGLKGQVLDIKEAYGTLYVGTLQGLFRLERGYFTQISNIEQACWQLTKRTDGSLMAATADGLFHVTKDKAEKVSPRHTLSVFFQKDGTYFTGELDGIYDDNSHMVAKTPNVVRMESDGKGGIWAISLYNETYHKEKGDKHFVMQKNPEMSLLLNYTDNKGNTWVPQENGLGLTDKRGNPLLKPWTRPLRDLPIQTMFIKDDIAWLGGNFGLIRWDIDLALSVKMVVPQAYIRNFTQTENEINFYVASNKIDPLGKTLVSYRFHNNDNWSAWHEEPGYTLQNFAPGSYQLKMRIMDANGNISETETKDFTILAPWYERWWAQMMYAFGLLILATLVHRWRLHLAQRQQQKLEQLVKERTQELQKAQHALLRQEREATIGKLTKGLIDRILNPMNYINNFSHLTRGLIKDLTEDIEDEKDKMSEDNYEDAADIMQMMETNLEKIEQHGLSTTRILKAMEEVLKERSKERVETDLCGICDKNVEMTMTYYAEHIRRSHVKCIWERPSQPITAVINADQISKVITAMLGNSAYALTARKKKEDYDPIIGLRLEKDAEGHAVITIFDNGIGIEPTIIDKVFDPFFTTKPTAEAPGIGLYIAQQIVQDHGGTITVKSEPLSLTEFTIRL